MYELKRDEEVERLIAITKSDSGISGPRLVEAHRELGRLLGAQIGQSGQFEPEETYMGGYFSRRGCIWLWGAGSGCMIRSMRSSCGLGRGM